MTQCHVPEDLSLAVFGKYSSITSKFPVHLPQSRFSHTITTYPTNGVSFPPILSTLHTRYRLTLTSSSPYVAEFRNFGVPSDYPIALLSVHVNLTAP